jgi:glycosyltransferase involved in cell wall biosynthesis
VDFLPRNSWFNRWKFRRARRVVCVSHWIARLLQDWGIPPEQLSVVHDAVPDDACQPRETCLQEIRERTGIPPGHHLVGNIGALVGHKDHATLLRAARIVTAQRGDVAFVIMGEGELKENLLRLRQELDLIRTVHFTGFIPQAQRLLPGFDVFAMSSSMEGLGSIVLDAGQAGVPVAATAGGGLPEIVLPGQTGILVPVGDAEKLAAAILRLLDDPALAAQLAAAARQRIRSEFSVATMARRYTEIYREALDEMNQRISV